MGPNKAVRESSLREESSALPCGLGAGSADINKNNWHHHPSKVTLRVHKALSYILGLLLALKLTPDKPRMVIPMLQRRNSEASVGQ